MKLTLIILIFFIIIFILGITNYIHNIRKNFIRQLLDEWNNQTNGWIVHETREPFKNDYYLMLDDHNNFFHHIHLKLNNWINIFYTMKQFDNIKNEIVYSETSKISIFSCPKKDVENMIKKYDFFKLTQNPIVCKRHNRYKYSR